MSHTVIVKSWNNGYGFIIEDGAAEGSPDFFVHRNDLVGAPACNKGDKVTFDKFFDEQKNKTRAVKVSGGTGTADTYGGGKGKGGGGGGGQQVCRHFQNTGSCSYGESCRFSHGDGGASYGGGYGGGYGAQAAYAQAPYGAQAAGYGQAPYGAYGQAAPAQAAYAYGAPAQAAYAAQPQAYGTQPQAAYATQAAYAAQPQAAYATAGYGAVRYSPY